MKLLGIITFNIILGVLFTYFGTSGDSRFLCDFLTNQILPISATIVGFNVSGVIFLMGHLLQIKGDFSRSKNEIKHNIYFMGIIFVILIFLLFIKPMSFENSLYEFTYQSLIMTLFFFQIYAVYEIISAVFNLKSN